MAVEIRLMKEEEASILAALSKEVNWNHSFEECQATVTIPGSKYNSLPGIVTVA